jgi:hypothetical protein
MQVMDFAGEAIRRKPFGHGVGIEKGAVNPLGVERSTRWSRTVLVLLVVISLLCGRSLIRRTGQGRQDKKFELFLPMNFAQKCVELKTMRRELRFAHATTETNLRAAGEI